MISIIAMDASNVAVLEKMEEFSGCAEVSKMSDREGDGAYVWCLSERS